MGFKESTIEKRYVYHGKIINVRADRAAVKRGESVREMVEHGGGSAMLCEKEDRILLVKQYRYVYGEEIWELPAGKVEKGEDPSATAIRELEEECGIRAERAELMFSVYPSPGYTNEIIRIYRMTGLSDGNSHFDDDEDITAQWFEKDSLRKMIACGEINDAKTLIALLAVL